MGEKNRDVDKSILGWTESITTDKNMIAEDIWGSLSHVSMLGAQRIIPAKNAAAILDTLLKLQNEFYEGKWTWIPEQEDIHMNVEKKVIDALGMDVGGRMHTCRSRNDQVKQNKREERRPALSA